MPRGELSDYLESHAATDGDLQLTGTWLLNIGLILLTQLLWKIKEIYIFRPLGCMLYCSVSMLVSRGGLSIAVLKVGGHV